MTLKLVTNLIRSLNTLDVLWGRLWPWISSPIPTDIKVSNRMEGSKHVDGTFRNPVDISNCYRLGFNNFNIIVCMFYSNCDEWLNVVSINTNNSLSQSDWWYHFKKPLCKNYNFIVLLTQCFNHRCYTIMSMMQCSFTLNLGVSWEKLSCLKFIVG